MKNLALIFSFLITALCAGPVQAQWPLDVHSGVHRGRITGQNIEWRSSFDPEWVHGGASRLQFARPLPAHAVLESDGGAPIVAIRDETGRITGVDFVGDAKRPTDLVTRVRTDAEWVDPPLARDAPQRVELSGVRLRPNDDSPLALRLTDIRHHAVDGDTADRLEERWGETEGRAVTLVPDQAYIDSGGLKPCLQSAGESRVGHAVLVGSLVLLLMSLAAAVKFFSKAARTEEAEAFLRDFGVEEW